MSLPDLKISERNREYNSYSSHIHSKVVYNYLFESMSHRMLDKVVIGLDSIVSKGWQSMGILHYLGLVDEHKGCFSHVSVPVAIEQIVSTGDPSWLKIADCLKRYQIDNNAVDKNVFKNVFDEQVRASKKDSKTNRLNRINSVSPFPERVEIISLGFKRNPDVAAEVFIRANGICEKCKKPAPFIRAKDNTPYLETHHLVPLSEGGEDSLANTVAVCPNCHCEFHYGIK
jgi:5-methylcytosine-specific restriction protein A